MPLVLRSVMLCAHMAHFRKMRDVEFVGKEKRKEKTMRTGRLQEREAKMETAAVAGCMLT